MIVFRVKEGGMMAIYMIILTVVDVIMVKPIIILIMGVIEYNKYGEGYGLEIRE